MVIHCLFGMRDSASSPELLTAWDENQVREDPEGWEFDCQESLKDLGDEYKKHAYIDIQVECLKLAEQVWGSKILGSIRPATHVGKRVLGGG